MPAPLPLGSIAGGRLSPLGPSPAVGGSAMAHIFINAAGMARPPCAPARPAPLMRLLRRLSAVLHLRVPT